MTYVSLSSASAASAYENEGLALVISHALVEKLSRKILGGFGASLTVGSGTACSQSAKASAKVGALGSDGSISRNLLATTFIASSNFEPLW